MFDEVLRKVRKLERGVNIQIHFEFDENGYFDRVCPSRECRTLFKVKFEDWRDIVRDEKVFCPLCRHDAKATDWNTPAQKRHIEQIAQSYVQKQIGRAMQSDASRFNRSQKQNGFIKLSMSCKPGVVPVPVPAKAADVMTQEFICEKCQCRYTSIGAAFFCPACGHNSVLNTFTNALSTVRKTIGAIPDIRQALVQATDENAAEDSVRHICENGLVKIVSSFQRYAETCFLLLANASTFKVRRNLFQNLTESDDLWRQATGTGYTDILNAEDYARLALYFQQRHVLSHLDGIIDQQYVDRSQDKRLDVGQRLIVSESSVLDLSRVTEILASGLYKIT
jgi:hypothetical protein